MHTVFVKPTYDESAIGVLKHGLIASSLFGNQGMPLDGGFHVRLDQIQDLPFPADTEEGLLDKRGIQDEMRHDYVGDRSRLLG